MEFIKLEKVKDGKYLKNYELTYLNKAGKEKKFEIVSRKELKTTEDLGKSASGVSIVATCQGKLLLLHEFRMEECIERELFEETGLKVKKIRTILPPSYAAVAISDVKTYIAFSEVEGEMSDHTSDNEDIKADFYSRDEVKKLLETEEFSSRAQMAAFFFTERSIYE